MITVQRTFTFAVSCEFQETDSAIEFLLHMGLASIRELDLVPAACAKGAVLTSALSHNLTHAMGQEVAELGRDCNRYCLQNNLKKERGSDLVTMRFALPDHKEELMYFYSWRNRRAR